ncbi:30S ribosome-binding factor RbfA [Acetonema longum]|uniref:Ribosome-binding factor A n=1 Tax=Acetonema longum DSM 6540 TaxID=1009370 RepID=F7NL95_9FIRM|nr:30S ribosome-binding factor RbfA [Acetonema longum]EGO63200.1 ribosome-binding factor A [Acetonema longum DSM 6540]
MGQLRIEKVQEFIKQEISNMILTELKDPRIGFVTVTRVEATGDLHQAKVFVSVMGSDESKAQSLKGLQSALGYLRTEIGKRIQLRITPELSFHLDETLDHSVKIQKLLDQIKQNEAGNADES